MTTPLDVLWAELPDLWVSIDPGDVHVGVAWWHGPVCFKAYESDPDTTTDRLLARVKDGSLRLVVYERFLLRGALAMQQQGSEFFTSQMIGVMRSDCRRHEVACVGYRPRDHKDLFKKREFKPPIRPHHEWASYGHGGHTKDAENLGEYHIHRILKRGKGY